MDLTVEPAKLSDTADTLAAAAAGITEALQLLDDGSTALVGAWEGDAKMAFLALYQRFAGDSTHLADSLAAIASALSTLSKDYGDADTKGAEAMPR